MDWSFDSVGANVQEKMEADMKEQQGVYSYGRGMLIQFESN